jgi:acetyl-CoA acyltransferase
MSENMVKELGFKPVAKLKCYTTVGCGADEMGVGPAYAIPKLLEIAGMDIKDIGLFEINEAFASQAILLHPSNSASKTTWTRSMSMAAAIALGHPLGCTGAKLCATLLRNMQDRGVKYGVESMCIGGGMGAAALFELCEIKPTFHRG